MGCSLRLWPQIYPPSLKLLLVGICSQPWESNVHLSLALPERMHQSHFFSNQVASTLKQGNNIIRLFKWKNWLVGWKSMGRRVVTYTHQSTDEGHTPFELALSQWSVLQLRPGSTNKSSLSHQRAHLHSRPAKSPPYLGFLYLCLGYKYLNVGPCMEFCCCLFI